MSAGRFIKIGGVFEALGGLQTVTGAVRSIVGVIIAKTIFAGCSFFCSVSGARVSGAMSVNSINYYGVSGSYITGTETVSTILSGVLTSLEVVSTVISFDGAGEPYGASVQLDGSVPTVNMSADYGSGFYAQLSTNQASALSLIATGPGTCALIADSCTELSVTAASGGLTLSATAEGVEADLELNGQFLLGLTVSLGADIFGLAGAPQVVTGAIHTFSGPFTAAMVNTILYAYNANFSSGGSLVIGGASATPAGGAYAGATITTPGTGYQVGDSFTPDAPHTIGAILTVAEVDEDGGIVYFNYDAEGEGYSVNPSVNLIPLSVSGEGFAGDVPITNPDLSLLIINGVTVTTN